MNEVCYFDTSALVKRYVKESGSARVDKLFSEAAVSCTASLAYAELYATAHRLRRDGLLRAKDLTRLLNAVEEDWRQLAIIEFTPEVRALVPRCSSDVALRGADLVHVASALAFKQRTGDLNVVAADRRVLNAIQDLGMTGIDPSA